MEIDQSTREIVSQLITEFNESIEQLKILREFCVYPELPIVITKIGIPQALNVPVNERQNLIRFLIVCWERENQRTSYFIDRMNLKAKQEEKEEI